jgi:hypothetical protein
MADGPELLALRYLLGASETSLQNVLLDRLNVAERTKKQIAELLEAWAQARAEALLAEWFLKHGAELVARIASKPAEVTEIKLPTKPGPQSVNLRETLRKLLESA